MNEQLFIEPEATLLEAFKRMDAARSKLLILGTPERYGGLVSIGELQRALIAGADLGLPLSELPDRGETVVATPADSRASIRERMLAIRAEFMPVVDERGGVREVVRWADLFAAEPIPPRRSLGDVPVVVMAGGRGTRLRPLTNVIPKPLIPIGSRSMLEHIIGRFRSVGCRRFFLTVNYLADALRYYVEQQTDYGPLVTYVREDEPLGTAGSLHLLRDALDVAFFVTNCDILVEQDYSEIYDHHLRGGYRMTVVTALRHHQVPYGTVETDDAGELARLSEKPELTYAINAGMYVLDPSLLAEVPTDRPFHITELIEDLRARGESVGVFPVSEGSWLDIGVWPEYLRHKDREL